MATVLRNTHPTIPPLATAINALKAQVGAGSSFHLDASEVTVTAANATDLASALVLVNQMLQVYRFHMADTLAHKVVGVDLASYADATDLATAITRVNDIKAKYNVHRASTTHHYTADATNVVAVADATDLASLQTLANDVKAKLNAHFASAPAAASIRVVSA